MNLNSSIEVLKKLIFELAPECDFPVAELQRCFTLAKGNIREAIMLAYDWYEDQNSLTPERCHSAKA